MGRKKRLKLQHVLWVGLLCSLVFGRYAVVSGAGLTFTPGFVRFDIPNGQNIQDESVAITNDTLSTVRLSAVVTDVDINSSALTTLTTSNSSATKSISISNPSFALAPNQSVNLKLRIDGSHLPAGGQYSSIVIKQLIESPKKSVPITQAVSIGVFIVKEEGSIRALSLKTNLPSSVRMSPPSTLELQLLAVGNVAIVPRAAVTVMEGDEVLAKATINDTSQTILPGSDKRFPIQLNYQKALSPGRHKVVVTYRYDGQPIPMTKESTFWYIPFWYLLLLLLGIAALILLARHYLRPITKHPSPKPIVESLPASVVPVAVTPQEIEASNFPLPSVEIIAVKAAQKPKKKVKRAPRPRKKSSKKLPPKKPDIAKRKLAKTVVKVNRKKPVKKSK